MRNTHYRKLTDVQVERIAARLQALNLTREQLLDRFEEALRTAGSPFMERSAVKMRLYRALRLRQRGPLSESTKAALAAALGWGMAEFEKEVLGHTVAPLARPNEKELAETTRDLTRIVQRLRALARPRKRWSV